MLPLLSALIPLVLALASDAFTPTQKNLSWLLSSPGSTPQIGPETGAPVFNGIATYISDHGSTRFVLYVEGLPVSGLQLVAQPGQPGAQIMDTGNARSPTS